MASFPPPNLHKTSSMVSAMAFNNPFEEEPKNSPPAIVGSVGVSLIPAPLSSQASRGGSSKKVRKSRLKPATKPPIRVLSTHRANFREMVHELTGMNSPHDAAGAAVAQTLPPALEYTSSAYLLPSQKALMHDEINNINIDLAFRQSLQHPQPHMGDGSTAFYNPSSSGVDLESLLARQCNASKNTSMCMERAVGEVSPEMLDMEHVLQLTELESFLMENLDDLFPCKMLHNVDSWLPSDAIHMELALHHDFLRHYCEDDWDIMSHSLSHVC